ncbi:acetate---CoA ligase (ADP-forming) subunit alpha,acdB; acetate---CoA ligase (ADP-forming) subunit beta [Thermoflexales bacterium]|nr:acetate---CoA ligase (ADP-forming) subunit alpha,acdB; acetate---CoA ligase (ADP-forming) subunit beta [Thermoflexales bacterium]
MLTALFAPRGIAVIGASRDRTKLGYGVARNLVASNYPGAIHFINPNADRILGQRCYPAIEAAPDPIDLAVVIVPASLVPQTIEACGQRGIQWAIIVSGGFRETDRAGAELEDQIVAIARRYGLRLIGPNCIGLIDTHVPFNTTFIKSVPNPGEIAFVSQSGAICQAVIDWGTGMGFGFSRIASLGNQADLSEAEVITALSSDPHTCVITMYLEGVKDGARFKQAVQEVAREKSIVALKVGRTTAGKRAVSSHTGALAGQETAYDVVFDRYGILRANNTEELFDWARALAWCPPLKGDRVAVLTNAGGPGILAVDALEANGLRLATLSAETVAALRSFLLPHAAFHNPIDMLASAGPHEYAESLRVLLQDAGVDAVLVISVPPPIEDPTPVAEAIAVAAKDAAQSAAKPVVVAVMGEATVGLALKVLRAFRLTDYRFPERAASALGALWRHAQWQARPADQAEILMEIDREAATQLLSAGRGEWLTGTLAARVLEAYRIWGPGEALLTSTEEAVQWAERFGYPVVLKIASPDIAHKSDIGGVALDLNDAASVRSAFVQIMTKARAAKPDAQIDGATIQPMLCFGQEVIIGAVRDEQFGPLIMFGAGGVEVEGQRDVAFGLAPLSRAEAEKLIEATFAGRRLRGFRGSTPADREAVIDRVLRLAQFVMDFPQVAEVEVNPLRVMAEGQGAVALDVRMRLTRNE